MKTRLLNLLPKILIVTVLSMATLIGYIKYESKTAEAAITFIEAVGSGTRSTFPLSTFATPTTAGEAVIVLASSGSSNGNAIVSVQDNKGDTYTKVFSSGCCSAKINYSVWYSLNVPAGVTAASSTIGASQSNSNSEMIAAHYTGIAAANAFDVSTSTVTTGKTSPWASPKATTTSASELIVGGDLCFGNGGTGCLTTNVPVFSGAWVQRATTTNSQANENDVLLFGDQIVSTIQNGIQSTGTKGATTSNYPWLASFVAAAGGGVTPGESYYNNSKTIYINAPTIYINYQYEQDRPKPLTLNKGKLWTPQV